MSDDGKDLEKKIAEVIFEYYRNWHNCMAAASEIVELIKEPSQDAKPKP